MPIPASCVIPLTRLRSPKNKSLLAAIVLTQRRSRGMHSKIHITWNNIVSSRSEFKCTSSNCLRNILAWFRKLERKTKIIGMKLDETVMFRGQNNSKISLKFCIIIKSDSQETFATVLSTNVAAVTSGASTIMRRVKWSSTGLQNLVSLTPLFHRAYNTDHGNNRKTYTGRAECTEIIVFVPLPEIRVKLCHEYPMSFKRNRKNGYPML